MVENYSYMENLTTIGDAIGGLNYASGGLLGVGIAALSFALVFITLKGGGNDTADSFAAASVVHLIVCVLLYFSTSNGLSLIGFKYLIFALVAVLGVLAYYATQR